MPGKKGRLLSNKRQMEENEHCSFTFSDNYNMKKNQIISTTEQMAATWI